MAIENSFKNKVVLVTAAVWLCFEEASYSMGQMLVVDGGMTIGGFEF